MPIENTTANRAYPLPNGENKLKDDVLRLIDALEGVDGDVADLFDALDGKAGFDSPAFTGEPTAPTAATGTESAQIATTAFVAAEIDLAIAGLLAGAPGALDTLNELAAALGNDANFSATVSAALAARLIAANNLSDLPNKATAFNEIKQLATDTLTGVVEKATSAEVLAGTADKYPDAALIKAYLDAKYPSPIYQSEDRARSNAAFADVPEMSRPVANGETWFVEAQIESTQSGAGTDSALIVSLNGPSASLIDYTSRAFRADGSVGGVQNGTAYDADSGTIGLTTAGGRLFLTGKFTFTAGGTLALRYRRFGASGTATLKKGSWVRFWRG